MLLTREVSSDAQLNLSRAPSKLVDVEDAPGEFMLKVILDVYSDLYGLVNT